MALALRYRLDLPPVERMPPAPGPCICRASTWQAPWHHLHCNLQSQSRTRRHDIVRDLLHEWFLSIGAYSTTEPRSLSAISDERPDLDVWLGMRRYLIDVAIVSPSAPSNRRAARRQLATARAMERAKARKYAAMAEANNATVIPFVIEDYGAFGEGATSFCRVLSNFLASDGRQASGAQSVEILIAGIAIAVQRGNARMVMDGVYGQMRLMEVLARNAAAERERLAMHHHLASYGVGAGGGSIQSLPPSIDQARGLGAPGFGGGGRA